SSIPTIHIGECVCARLAWLGLPLIKKSRHTHTLFLWCEVFGYNKGKLPLLQLVVKAYDFSNELMNSEGP
ncbi:MAG TPA: hypothetical protein VJ643_00150, partial [Nitrososphaera sp.]|nr:hypothetical protein [Nitrososphaera sp.]